MSIWEYANPVRFMRLSGKVLPVLSVLAVVTLLSALIWGFFFTLDDVKQGATVKIIFIHVPTAFLAINIYFMMFVTSLIWLIRRHHVSALAAKAAAPVGAVMTLIALFSGAVWGQPIWNTWWVWDPRLTSFLILFVFYIGYIALWAAVDEADKAADLTSILCMIGSIFAVVSRYAVQFWGDVGLHQNKSMTMVPLPDGSAAPVTTPPMDASYYWPLALAILGFFLLFVVLLLLRTRTEIRNRRIAALRAREA